eukprot:g31991.t1
MALEDGPVQHWNDLCANAHEPWKRLHIGGTILSVNGITGDTKRMQQEMEKTQQAELLICNPPGISSLRAVMAACEGADLKLHQTFWQDVEAAAAMPAARTTLETLADCDVREAEMMPQVECANISVVVTTSPVRSNPSTDLLERVLLSLHLVGLAHVPRIIVCDGYKISAGKSNHKAGKISVAEAERYSEYIQKLQERATGAESVRSAYFRTQILVLPDHHGFGFAVKSALAEVDTDYAP